MSINRFLSEDKYSVARGLIANTTPVRVYGLNQQLSTTQETIWENGSIYTYPTTANNVVLVSTSANDTANGTGAQSIYIEGLDANYNVISEMIALNGLTSVQTVNQYLRVNDMYVDIAGSLGMAAGTINATINGTLVDSLTGSLGNSNLKGTYTIPAGKTGYLCKIFTSSSGGGDVLFSFWHRQYGKAAVTNFYEISYRNSRTYIHEFPLPLPEKTDLEMRGECLTGSASTSCELLILLIDNPVPIG